MDLTKLGRTERVLAIVGLLTFIDSFLSGWYTVSAPSASVLGVTYAGGSAGFNAWQYPSGFLTWFPALLFFALAVIVLLPAFGVFVKLPASVSLIGLGVSAVAVLFYLIQWATYPSVPAELAGVSAGADWAYFIALVLAIGAGVFAYLGFKAEGGSLAALGQSIKARTQQPQQGGYVPPAGGYVPPAPGYGPPPEQQQAPGTWQQQPPQQ